MKHFTPLFLLLALISCQKEPKLTIAPLLLEGGDCESCAQVHILVPQLLDETSVAKTINTAISEELIYFLKFDEEEEVNTVEAAMASFGNSYQKMVKEFGATAAPWEAEVLGEIAYESPVLVSLKLDTYSFTGGAHGYGARIWLNFDAVSGKELDPTELFMDVEGFAKMVETNFRSTYGIPQNAPINSSGFMFEEDTFHLPEHMGFTPTGLQLHYNQYEIASYADGPIAFTLPFKEVNAFLKEAYRITPN
ncbi:Hypothetical protein I595_1394 [Croceitalea dokdonensis DOKDO 023]|uniref:DUF3298 domain-containing protein n=1 Tax=Croceitalea dokdonensis DOKDO 023 TaxID=1300341 RepID=A0A0P7AY18_9FLAO|nr:DUF3298 and DUF4163 domain-containing protein [Croceitalea dokdonensis]KPM32967.1 Hypothetical protein I595_1394 [Croceitalea dokdonensis DOKDO 023]